MAVTSTYDMTRHWLLHELRRVRASLRVATSSLANAGKDHKYLQRELVKLRRTLR